MLDLITEAFTYSQGLGTPKLDLGHLLGQSCDEKEGRRRIFEIPICTLFT